MHRLCYLSTLSSNLSSDELAALGLASCGRDVRIDRRVAIFNPSTIRIGSHVRIDAYSVLAGGVAELKLGSFVHLSAACYLSAGDGGIAIDDFCTLAPRVAVHGHSDDYLDGMLTGGSVPADLTGGVGGPITLERHVIIGSGSVVLPNVVIGFGAAIGALSLVRKSVAPGIVAAGNPLRALKTRNIARLDELAAMAWQSVDASS